MTYKCSVCSTEFKGKRHKESKRVYCSVKCFKAKPIKWTTKDCLVCSKTFRTSPNWIKRGGGKYCSWTCSAASKRKQKIQRACEQCLTVFTVKPCAIKYNASRFCSSECSNDNKIGKMPYECKAEKNPNWKGGIQFAPYPFEFNDSLKQRIRQRDGYSCQHCNMSNEEHILVYGYELVIHHMDYVKENCSELNLITTCIACNSRANFNREHWTEYFKNKLQGASHEV